MKRKFDEPNGCRIHVEQNDRVFEDLNNGKLLPRQVRPPPRPQCGCGLDAEHVGTGAIFVYATGNTLTLPVQRYFLEGLVTDVYGPRMDTGSSPITERI